MSIFVKNWFLRTKFWFLKVKIVGIVQNCGFLDHFFLFNIIKFIDFQIRFDTDSYY